MSRFADAMMAPLSDGVEGTTRPCQPDAEKLSDEDEEGVLPTTFTADDLRKGVLRGTPAHEIVAGAGKHWAPNSLLSEQGKSWAFSKAVRKNTVFTSHSWLASRFLKWLALLGFFNGRAAAIASLITSFAAVLVDVLVPIESLRAPSEAVLFGSQRQLTCSFLPFLTGTLVGVTVFFAGHHFRRVFEAAQLLESRSAFLDKLVIHQDDPELKARGISLLGAFIRTSDVFLILWSKEYIGRLWCSYEVAVFAHLKRSTDYSGRLCIWPLPLVKIVGAKVTKVIGMATMNMIVIMFLENGISMTMAAMTFLGTLVPVAIGTAGMVELFHEVDTIDHQFNTYDLHNAGCFNPADRESVERSVTNWFEPKCRELAIAKFNAFVREEIRACIGDSFGNGGINYTAAIWAALPMLFFDVLSYACNVSNVDLSPEQYVALCFGSMVQDIPGQMLLMLLQFRVVSLIERRRQRDQVYASLPAQDGAATQASFARCSFLLEVIVCTAVDFFFSLVFILIFAWSLPMSVGLSVFAIALTIYCYK